MEYLASSVADSIRYEEEIIRTLHDSNYEIPITIEDLSLCSRCERRDKCLISVLDLFWGHRGRFFMGDVASVWTNAYSILFRPEERRVN